MEPSAIAIGPAADVEEATRRLLAQESTFEQFTEVFLHGRLWFKKGEELGFQAVGEPGRGYVPIFTSDRALARAEGQCEWISTTGRDLLGLVPEGYGFVLNHGSDTELYVVPMTEAAE